MNKGRYLVVADRNGKLSVMVNEDWNPRPTDVLLAKLDTVDDAFDWKQDMESKIARANHCATCE